MLICNVLLKFNNDLNNCLELRRKKDFFGLGIFYHWHYSVLPVPGGNKKQSFSCSCHWYKFRTDNTPLIACTGAELSHPRTVGMPLVPIISLLEKESCRASCVMWLHFVVTKEIYLYQHRKKSVGAHQTINNARKKDSREKIWCV